jgi:glycosyltransferase involved in cell wall biosynthesis
MFENRDIIMIGSDWKLQAGVLQHLTRLLLLRNRVLWVSGIPLRAPRFDVRDIRRVVEKGRMMLATSVNSHDRSVPVTEVHPLFIPWYDSTVVRRFNDGQLRSLLLAKIREMGFRNHLVFTQNPMVANVLGTLGESSSHYLCIDDFGANKGSFRCLEPLEQETLQRVDSCFVMSDVLMKTRVPKSGEIHFFPEGVDLDHFRARGGPPPEPLAGIKRPIAGYAGILEWWVDYELLTRCAAAYPDVSFVILGTVKTDIAMLSRYPNIFSLGHIPFDELPGYLEFFDVGLIPRRINRLTVAMNPLKLLEYLAMEMPVVSTNLPEVKKFAGLVSVAEDDEQFVRLVGEALNDNTAERKRSRRALAERFSWKSVLDRMSDEILAIETRKKRTTKGSEVAPPVRA